MAMSYGHVYVARVAFGAKDAQTRQGLPRGRGVPGAVAHHRLQPLHRPRLRHGVRRRAAEAGRRARASGRSTASTRAAWPTGEPPLQLDSGRPRPRWPTTCATRRASGMVEQADPDALQAARCSRPSSSATQRCAVYQQLAGITVPPSDETGEANARRRAGAKLRRTHGPLAPRYLGLDAAPPAHARAPRRWSTTSTPCAGSRTPARRPSSCTRSSRSRSPASRWRAFLHTESHGESFAEALSYFPDPAELRARARGLPRAPAARQGGGERSR